ncbi:MAG: hypothetical protein ACK4FJ_10485 [Ferrovibrio sp.]|uniref:alpha/beta hydrolase n=1 Tax=Ferrovibrio sp. TaxID=1917215 RepID=UPI00391AAD96
MWRKIITRVVILAGLLAFAASAEAQPIPIGDGYRVVKAGDYNLELFTYKPAGYTDGALLLVFHGVARDADVYRDNAKTIADRYGLAVVAPLFDKNRFPSALYQRGGIANQKALQPQEKWIGTTLLRLIEILRREEGRADWPYYLIGHSAGGQFLSRFAAFVPHAAKRIVVANPSSWVFPTAKEEFPYGLGGATASLVNDDFMKRYLAAPLTVYLGMTDTGTTNRDDNEDAVEQGVTRHERGLNFFRAGQALAQEKGWVLNWRLVEVPKVGHSSKRMFDAPQVKDALFGP